MSVFADTANILEDEVHFISDCPIHELPWNKYLPPRHPDKYFINLFKTSSDIVKFKNLAIFIGYIWHWERRNYVKIQTLYLLFLQYSDPYTHNIIYM